MENTWITIDVVSVDTETQKYCTIARLKVHRNSLLPMFSIPAEVLGEIFISAIFCLPNTSAGMEDTGLIREAEIFTTRPASTFVGLLTQTSTNNPSSTRQYLRSSLATIGHPPQSLSIFPQSVSSSSASHARFLTLMQTRTTGTGTGSSIFFPHETYMLSQGAC